MTAPDRPTPEGAYQSTGVHELQDITEETVRAYGRQPYLDAYQGGSGSPLPRFTSLFSGFLNLGHLLGSITSALTGGSGGGAGTTIGTLLTRLSTWATGVNDVGEANSQAIISISSAQQIANERLDDLESFAGTGVTTPLATSIGGRDIVTFPDSLMMKLFYVETTNPKATEIPAFTQGKGFIDFGFIRGGQDADVPIEMLRIVTGGDTGVFGINQWYLGIYVYDIANARLAKIWDSGDLRSTLMSQRQRYNIATGLSAKAKNDQLLAVATLQIAPGLAQTPRGIGCLFQTGISEPAGVIPQGRGAFMSGQSTLPQYVPMSSLTWDKTKVLWAGIGPVVA